MARLYADEDFSFPVVEHLRRLGHDVLTAQEGGQANQKTPDTAVLAFATSLSRAVTTFNRRHFRKLHRVTRPHAGIVVCTRDDDTAALATRIDQAIRSVVPLDDQLVEVNKPP